MRCMHQQCLICGCISDKYFCGTSNVVYQYTCKSCQEKYIGKTDNTIYNRFYQHRMAVNRSDEKNPLVRHMIEKHADDQHDIRSWDFEILKRCSGNPVDTALEEADFIDKQKPEINKKRECRTLFQSK